jgi:hypothetical protein
MRVDICMPDVSYVRVCSVYECIVRGCPLYECMHARCFSVYTIYLLYVCMSSDVCSAELYICIVQERYFTCACAYQYMAICTQVEHEARGYAFHQTFLHTCAHMCKQIWLYAHRLGHEAQGYAFFDKYANVYIIYGHTHTGWGRGPHEARGYAFFNTYVHMYIIYGHTHTGWGIRPHEARGYAFVVVSTITGIRWSNSAGSYPRTVGYAQVRDMDLYVCECMCILHACEFLCM